ncbi:EAL domain-containing protein [Clostridiaceae bacterium HSG29]|nr:EAL domain-containing protein [Clostridiaceae bacterium HSG29]
MFKNLSIKNKFIISIFLGCLIPYILGGLYIKNYTEKFLYNKDIDNTRQIVEEISEKIEYLTFTQTKNYINMLIKAEPIQNISGDISTYMNYKSDEFLYDPSTKEQKISDYFSSFKETDEFVNFISLGTDYGGYIEYPKFSPIDNYDPRTREWYENTINSQTVNISKPYISKVTKDIIVSATKAFKNKNDVSGVLGISVKLSYLMKNITTQKIGDSGYIMILDNNNEILVSPKHEDWILKTPEELNVEGISCLSNMSSGSCELKIDNDIKIINVYSSPISNWKYIAVSDKDEILSESKNAMYMLFAIFTIILLITFMIISLVSKRITEPILEIANDINYLSDFEFHTYNSKKFEKLNSCCIEIRTISKALNKMHSNLFELDKNISRMDLEIKNISIEENIDYELSLKKDSLFGYVAVSINRLLKNISKYLEQIKENNIEIATKNELLQSSEEELRAQIEEITFQKEYIEFFADHDILTELPNRRKLTEKLQNYLTEGVNGIVALLDLDNFKRINDTLGHVFGDLVLKEFSDRLITISEKNNIFVSRFGGDEFLILSDCETKEEIEEFVNKLHEVLDERMMINGNEIDIKFSMGITLFPSDSNDIDELIMNADLALYTIKNEVKNDYAIFNESMKKELRENTEIELILSKAIENDGFKIFYQPQVELKTGEIICYEALIRLKEYSISPGQFIPIAEKNGMIIKIGRIVTEKVIEQLSIWKEKGYLIKPVSINYSAIQINDNNYFDFLMNTLKSYNVNPKLIEIEITENILLKNNEKALKFLEKLRNENIKIAIDDFGTGYSSLSYLTFLPIDKVKFDRSLNLELLNMKNTQVMNSLISVMHSLELVIVSEGIEEYEHIKKLEKDNCDIVQGYYFSKPLEVEDVEKTFNSNYLNQISNDTA